jgi:hypothetical protein
MLPIETEDSPTDPGGRTTPPPRVRGEPAPTGLALAHRAVTVVVRDLTRLPSTVRIGLGVLGLFGLADIVAHLGVPTAADGGSTDSGQLVAHLGVLVGMIVVLVGIVSGASTRALPSARRPPARRPTRSGPAAGEAQPEPRMGSSSHLS